ncbi:hypothetical protein COO91_05226 [Nostoc flagelliforme CCNUN1]|uniref:Uncharacterized protein n=1 Tax=Nostoc flagelliforme CCNUN1 TaxID=2038116 RepID=A0A2K8SUU9_9NOSO|nr:hypothetical protein COO91_05226 [Nostoc flagelliforme CCNUN1]
MIDFGRGWQYQQDHSTKHNGLVLCRSYARRKHHKNTLFFSDIQQQYNGKL